MKNVKAKHFFYLMVLFLPVFLGVFWGYQIGNKDPQSAHAAPNVAPVTDRMVYNTGRNTSGATTFGLFNTTTGALIAQWQVSAPTYVMDAFFNCDGSRLILTFPNEKYILFVDSITGQTIARYDTPGETSGNINDWSCSPRANK